MLIPDYKNGSIVNLMSSIVKARGGKPPHKPLPLLPPSDLSASKNIVLLVLDGLGYEYIKKYGKGSLLHSYLTGKITSVFPTTTASAITTFMTGFSPQEHGVTGWFMFLKELGMVSAVLPFVPRAGGHPMDARTAQLIFNQPSIFSKMNCQSWMVLGESIVNSPYTLAHAKGARRIAYRNLNGLFLGIQMGIKSLAPRKYAGKKFVYAYWPEFDSLSHKFGPAHQRVHRHFKIIEKHTRAFLKSMQGTDTTVIITADHGQIATPHSKVVRVENHPVLADSLILPLCGEPRAAYCYVHPDKKKEFESYVKLRLKRYCTLFKSGTLQKKGLFGRGNSHPKLMDRIGHYVLLMKEDYIIKDSLLGRPEHIFAGNHGGLSKEELFVPLVVIHC